MHKCLQETPFLHIRNIWEGRGHRNTLHAGPTYCFPFSLYNTGAPWPRDSGKEWAALLEGEKSLALQEEPLHAHRQVLSFDLGGSGTKKTVMCQDLGHRERYVSRDPAFKLPCAELKYGSMLQVGS